MDLVVERRRLLCRSCCLVLSLARNREASGGQAEVWSWDEGGGRERGLRGRGGRGRGVEHVCYGGEAVF